jgi:hypothetical protein
MLSFILVICLISLLLTSSIVNSQEPPEDEPEGPQQISLTREMVDNLLQILSPGIKDIEIYILIQLFPV